MVTRLHRSLILGLALVTFGASSCSTQSSQSQSVLDATSLSVDSTKSQAGSDGSAAITRYRDYLVDEVAVDRATLRNVPAGFEAVAVSGASAARGWRVMEEWQGPSPNGELTCVLRLSRFVGGELAGRTPPVDGSGQVLRVLALCD